MTERQLQFRVGLFVLASTAVATVLVFQFGEFRSIWQPSYRVAIRFDSAAGISPATQVQMNGISIGQVRDVHLDDNGAGVVVVASIRDGYRIPNDANPRIVRSLLGDTSIEISGGGSDSFAAEGTQFSGDLPADPMQAVQQLSSEVATTLKAFNQTSREWQQVGRNLNSVLNDNQAEMKQALAQTTQALGEFRATMATANRTLAEAGEVLSDPEYRENLRQTLKALPELVDQTRQTIQTVRTTVQSVDRNLTQISDVTAPFAQNSRRMATRLNNTLTNVETLSAELVVFSQLLKNEEGSLKKLVSDPELYRNLKSSTASLAVLLNNMEPIVHDMQIFSDKIARHPELIGVGGAIRGSSGLKNADDGEPQVRPASGRGLLNRR